MCSIVLRNKNAILTSDEFSGHLIDPITEQTKCDQNANLCEKKGRVVVSMWKFTQTFS